MAFNTYACPPAMLALAKPKKTVDQPQFDTSERRWISRAGWAPGLAAPLVRSGAVLSEPVMEAGNACLARQRRHAACMWEYAQALDSYCRIGLGLISRNGGVSAEIAGFKRSLSASADDSANAVLRENVVAAAGTMTRHINHLRASLERAARDAGADAAESVRIVNLHLDAVAQWNRAVSLHMKSPPDAPPEQALAARLPHRESALDELYRHVDIDVDEKRSGSLIVSMHGANLVYFDRKAEYAPGQANLSPFAGKLAAQIEARDRLFPQCGELIAGWAETFASLVNAAYTSVNGRKGESEPPGNDMFVVDASTRILVHPALVAEPQSFRPGAGRQALAAIEQSPPGLRFDALFTEKIADNAAGRDLSADMLERVSRQKRMIANGCGEKEMADLVQCHRAFVSAYHQSALAELTYRKLAEGSA